MIKQEKWLSKRETTVPSKGSTTGKARHIPESMHIELMQRTWGTHKTLIQWLGTFLCYYEAPYCVLKGLNRPEPL